MGERIDLLVDGASAALPAILTSQGVDLLSATAATLLLRGLQTLPLGLLAVAAYLALSRRDYKVPARQEPAGDPVPE